MAGLLLKEIRDYPNVLRSALHFQAESRQSDASLSQDELQSREDWFGDKATWRDGLLAALPFLLFGLSYLISALMELRYTTQNPAYNLNVPQYVVVFITAAGVAFAWIKRFPRWSYAYVGMSLWLGYYFSNGSFYGVIFAWRAWLPLGAALLVGLLITRSLKPLARLFQGFWQDWTCLSFVLYASVLPVFTVVFFDGEWGTLELVGLAFDTLLLATGAFLFVRTGTTWRRIIALQGAMICMLIWHILLTDWYGGPLMQDINLSLFSVGSILFFWGGLLRPGLLGLLRLGVRTALKTR
jgi:hypothetical protein